MVAYPVGFSDADRDCCCEPGESTNKPLVLKLGQNNLEDSILCGTKQKSHRNWKKEGESPSKGSGEERRCLGFDVVEIKRV